jgi:hypothetical protein
LVHILDWVGDLMILLMADLVMVVLGMVDSAMEVLGMVDGILTMLDIGTLTEFTMDIMVVVISLVHQVEECIFKILEQHIQVPQALPLIVMQQVQETIIM